MFALFIEISQVEWGTVQDSPPHQFITTFDNEVGLLSYAYALAQICSYDNWSLQKLKVKKSREVEQAKYQEGKNPNFLFELVSWWNAAVFGLKMIADNVVVTPVYALWHNNVYHACFSAIKYSIMVYKSLRNKISVHLRKYCFGFTAMNWCGFTSHPHDELMY